MKNYKFNSRTFRQHYETDSQVAIGERLYLALFGFYPSEFQRHIVSADEIQDFLAKRGFERLSFHANGNTLDEGSPWYHRIYVHTKSQFIVKLESEAKLTGISRKDVSVKKTGMFCSVRVYSPVGQLEQLANEISQFCYDFEQTSTISFLVQQGMGISSMRFEAPKIQIDDLGLNYGEKFIPVHERISDALTNQPKGLILLYGKPGTGKTSYLKHLITLAPNKEKIYISADTAHILTRPDFIQTLVDRKNSVLFIEDAESVVRTREAGEISPGVTNLLNLADGILGDCLSIQVVCTFNTDIKNVDPALRRKGRLIAEYDFAPLQPREANRLFAKLGTKHSTIEPMTLAEIYKYHEDNFTADDGKKVITGFGG